MQCQAPMLIIKKLRTKDSDIHARRRHGLSKLSKLHAATMQVLTNAFSRLANVNFVQTGVLDAAMVALDLLTQQPLLQAALVGCSSLCCILDKD